MSVGVYRAMPTTQWDLIEILRSASPETERQHALNTLTRMYWEPVFCYIRHRGHSEDDTKDLTQDFILHWIQKSGFTRAHSDRGRFRSYLISSLENYLKNAHRRASALRRQPAGGLVPLDETRTSPKIQFIPRNEETPEDIFNRAWASNIVRQTLEALESECHETGKDIHFTLFRIRIYEPAFEGTTPPSLGTLAASLGLTEKQAENRLVTARRAFQRLLREHIRNYTFTDAEVGVELRELLQLLSGT